MSVWAIFKVTTSHNLLLSLSIVVVLGITKEGHGGSRNKVGFLNLAELPVGIDQATFQSLV